MKVTLIPWDPESEEHSQRLYDQRIACGWKAEKVGRWKELQREGVMAIHWVILDPSDSRAESMLAEHTKKYPTELEPLTDSATSLYGKRRTAPPTSIFNPIGHISLDTVQPSEPSLEKPGLFWITTLYISRAIQKVGLGSAAMDAIEELGVKGPLAAKGFGLDTLAREMAIDRELHKAAGLEVPTIVNQDWYERRGYKDVLFKKDGYTTIARDGTERTVDLVFMIKDRTAVLS